MEGEWKKVLDKYKVPFFHMKDCAPGNKPFNHLKKWERAKLIKRMIEILKAYTSIGFVAVVNPRRFGDYPGIPDPYTYCVNLCLMGLASWLDDSNENERSVKLRSLSRAGIKTVRKPTLKSGDGQKTKMAKSSMQPMHSWRKRRHL
jgi:hypothetical protein